MFKKYFLPFLIFFALAALIFLTYYKLNEYKPKEQTCLAITGESGSTLFLTAVAQKNHFTKTYDQYLVATLYADSCRTVIKDTIDCLITYHTLYKYSQPFFEIASGQSLFSGFNYTYTSQGVYLPALARVALYSEYLYPNQTSEYAPELQLKLTDRFALWLNILPDQSREMFILLDGKPYEKVADLPSTYANYLTLQDASKFFAKYP